MGINFGGAKGRDQFLAFLEAQVAISLVHKRIRSQNRENLFQNDSFFLLVMNCYNNLFQLQRQQQQLLREHHSQYVSTSRE